jgi:hypothetical protein
MAPRSLAPPRSAAERLETGHPALRRSAIDQAAAPFAIRDYRITISDF